MTLDQTLMDPAAGAGHESIVPVTCSFPGFVPSLNDFIGKNRHTYNNAKHYWGAIIKAALHGPVGRVEIPKPNTKTLTLTLDIEREGELEGVYRRITVDGHITFPGRNVGPRDQGNARSGLEKFLGDVLEECSHFERGDVWDAYEFGSLGRDFQKGVSRTRLLILAQR